ncbi:hypothetical protein [Asticcacaulis sp.]|uniref:type II toxin-antitoxin system Phd/YefM family antitoxin n=1 Tax=Asticcacaulis sp. TaxID=1872648 RepID=UPI002B80D2FB|nr:hypothetical protein [Asticcacaulis sp.]HTM82203.1 hypothetical protein [Asticcacaulis sp.]
MPRVSANIPSPRRIGIREFRGNLNGFLQEVQAGQSFVLTSHHKAVAEVRPAQSVDIERRPGALRGRIKLSKDFDVMPDEELKAMESGD